MNKSSSTYAVRTHEPSLATPLFMEKWAVMYLCASVNFISFYHLFTSFWNCSDSALFYYHYIWDQGVRCTTLCAKVYQWLATGWRFSPGPPVSAINKNGRHNIAEILLKVALNTIKQTNKQIYFPSHFLIILEFWDINKCKFSKKIIK